jgi:hypothetical protein
MLEIICLKSTDAWLLTKLARSAHERATNDHVPDTIERPKILCRIAFDDQQVRP